MYKFIFIHVFIVIGIGTICAQSKQTPGPEDYDLWYALKLRSTAPKGDWMELYKDYETLQDTTEIRAISGNQVYTFTNIRTTELYDNWFFFKTRRGIGILNLRTGKQTIFEGYSRYTYVQQTQSLILETRKEGIALKLVNLFTLEEQDFVNLFDYTLSPDQTRLLYAQRGATKPELGIYNLQTKTKQPVHLNLEAGEVSQLIWNPDVDKIAFYYMEATAKKELQIMQYNLKDDTSLLFEPDKREDFPSNKHIVKRETYKPFTFSKTGQRLYFCTRLKRERELSWGDLVEIYRTKDTDEVMNPRYVKAHLNATDYGVWNLETDQFHSLTDSIWQESYLTSNDSLILLTNSKSYRPKLKLVNDADLKLINTKSGKIVLNVSKTEGVTSHTGFAPNGRFLYYYKQGNWLIYDIKKKVELNLSSYIPTSLSRRDPSQSQTPYPYGIGGFDQTGTQLLVYDQYDIWMIDLNTLITKRLTKGRESGKTYRLVKSKQSLQDWEGASLFTPSIVDLKKPLYIQSSTNNYSSGFACYNQGIFTEIVFKAARLYNPKITHNGLLYIEENHNLPPRVMLWKTDTKKTQVLYQSNAHFNHFNKGSAELVHTTVSEDSEALKAALLYPFNYDPAESYPMIVDIYEQKASAIHKYSVPSRMGNTGINHFILRSLGYFVLCPNIHFYAGYPGNSANKSINALLNVVLKKPAIDSTRLGLIGFSFGGYETNYIVTHNTRFAAAVSGGSISDLVMRYTSLTGIGDHKFFQFENYQGRMQGPYYEHQQAYIDNSPLWNVDRVSTPLLLYAGKEDYHVNRNQSIAFYLGLKRAGKEASLLLYPNEAHGFSNSLAVKDINKRILEWFEHYLKGGKKQQWMKADHY